MTIKRENLAMHLIETELKYANKKLLDIADDDKWRFNFTMTAKEHQEFKKYSIALIQKVLRINKSKAIDTFQWFYMNYGLRIKNKKDGQ